MLNGFAFVRVLWFNTPSADRYNKQRGNKMTDFWTNYYKSLEGATILKFAGMNDSENGQGFPCFQVKFANGKEGFIEISQDPEGNGGGFIFGLEMPADK